MMLYHVILPGMNLLIEHADKPLRFSSYFFHGTRKLSERFAGSILFHCYC